MVDMQEAAPPPAPNRRRRRRYSVYVVAPIAFLLLLGAGRITYWRVSVAYDPLVSGGFVGSTPGTPDHLAGAESASWQLSGPPGTIQVVEFNLRNGGRLPLQISAVDVSDPLILNVHWAAYHSGVDIPGPSHDFPLPLPARAAAKIRFTIVKPECGDGARLLSTVVTLHWHAMMSSHATRLDLAADNPTLLALCGG